MLSLILQSKIAAMHPKERLCVTYFELGVPTSRFFVTREISIAGDLCVHFGDEWAFGKMSRKTWIERVGVCCQ